MSSGLYQILKRLSDSGSVPSSAVSKRSECRLRPLLDSGALIRRRRGRGMVLDVEDMAALDAFVGKLFPHGDMAPAMADGSPLPPRGAAVALYRDAKRSRVTSAEPVLLRATAAATASRGVECVDLHAMTRLTGAVCLLIDDTSAWRLTGTIAIVENLEVFLHVESLKLPADIALYAGGRLSRRVLAWLTSDAMTGCSYLHCGDYDPVGIDEYLRLRAGLETRSGLFLPDTLAALFARYGKRDLLRDSTAVLARLRTVDLPDVQQVVHLMDETGCGLEQEALLVERG